MFDPYTHAPLYFYPFSDDLKNSLGEYAPRVPKYATEHASGMDIHAHLDSPMTLEPGLVCTVPTNLCVDLDPGWELQLRARSSLGFKGIILPNGIGTIDADYQGHIKVMLLNLGKEPYVVNDGDRIAQAVLCQVETCEPELSTAPRHKTTRGEGGFGSTGK